MESSDGKLIANAFLDVFRNVSRREAVERALANVCKMLGDPQLAKVSSEYFMPEINKTVTLSNIDAYKALTRLMLNAKNGWFVREKASFILGVLLSKSESLRNESFFSGEEGEEQEAGEEQRCSEEMQTARTVVRWSIDLLGGGDGSLVDASGGDGPGGTMTIQRGGGGDENHEENEERVIPTAIHALASVLQHRKTRPLARNLGAYKLIAPLLDSEKFNPNSRVQVLYEAALCAWLLSFDAKARKQALKIDNAIVVKKLINAAKTATKEKVVRVAIMALKNILIGLADSGIDDAKKVPSMKSGEGDRHSNKENAAAAAHVGGKRDDDKDDEDDELGPIAETCIERESLQKVCENLAHRGFEDAELVDNLEQLAKGLAKRRVVASSWERYLTEVRSGSLDWSPSHTDEGFWRNECSKLTDNNCFVLRNLIAMMSSRDVDPRTLAVACHDVGEFATHYPAGRFLACDLGAKTAAMALMVHEDEEVKAKSLVCVQKLLVANWKFIGGGN
jgi:V-type H+-transporting ATPase subunit H